MNVRFSRVPASSYDEALAPSIRSTSLAVTFALLSLAAGCSSSSSDPGNTNPDAGSQADAAGGADSAAPASDAGSSTDAAPPGDAGTMACDLQITDADGSNVALTEFAAAAGQGSTTHKSGHPQVQGIHVTSNTSDTIRSLDISVAGDAPASGATYTLDPPTIDENSAVIFTLSNVTSGELRAWDGVGGGTVSVVSVTPGATSSYVNVTFGFDHLALTPRALANDNKAQGDFKITGQCTGAITK